MNTNDQSIPNVDILRTRQTPRTDAVMQDPFRDGNDLPELARTLETENSELRRERDEARDRVAELEKQLAELQKPKEPETFKFCSRTWIKHTPGYPMPCEANANVRVLLACEQQGSSDYCHGTSSAERWNWSNKIDPPVQIIGWNYADAP